MASGAGRMDQHLKSYRDGTHRSRDPQETFARVKSFLPVFGITRIANITGLDTVGLPVIMVVRPNSRSLSVSQGKGLTLEAAKISGVMEAIESYHAETLDIETRILDYNEMARHHRVVDIQGLCLNKDKPFDEQAKIPWVRGEDLLQGEEIWLPYELVHMDYTLPPGFDNGYFIPSSNGLASGNCAVEAINHGLCETIERDALTLWSLQDQSYRDAHRVDLSSIRDASCRMLLERFQAAELLVAVWDITTDISIPAYLCKISNLHIGVDDPRPAMGAGCHPSKTIALSRALTEAAQSRLTFIAGSRDDQPARIYQKYKNEDILAAWNAEILAGAGVVDFGQRAGWESEFLEQDYRGILECLKNAGFREVCMVDLTKAAFNISVVKIIIPGLENHLSPERRVLKKRGLAVFEQGKQQ